MCFGFLQYLKTVFNIDQEIFNIYIQIKCLSNREAVNVAFRWDLKPKKIVYLLCNKGILLALLLFC